jgi:hypothetical protein
MLLVRPRGPDQGTPFFNLFKCWWQCFHTVNQKMGAGGFAETLNKRRRDNTELP